MVGNSQAGGGGGGGGKEYDRVQGEDLEAFKGTGGQETKQGKRPRFDDGTDLETSVLNNTDITEIEGKVDMIIVKLELVPPCTQKSQLDSIKNKLDFIFKNLQISTTVDVLQQVVREVHQMTISDEKIDDGTISKEEASQLLLACKSVTEIESKIPEFQYCEEQDPKGP